MKILLIQLSDIHFKEGSNSILEKEEQIFNAVRNETISYDEIFIVITGDSAYSGKQTEYKIASDFILKLKQNVADYSGKKVNCVIIPGNHDCNFEKDSQARRNQINIIQKIGDSAIDESVINQCAEIQTDYFEY